MKSWLVGCTGAVVFGVGFFLVSKKPPTAIPVASEPVASHAVAAAVPQPPAPPASVLDRVIETADIDSLLDPPAIPRTEARTIHEPLLIQVGFEEPASPAAPSTVVPPIPKSESE